MDTCFEASASLQEIKFLALKFLASFPEGGIFLFPSEMGSGKTTFCRSIIEESGYPFEGSPTFAIAHQYASAARPSILHADLYRVNYLAELEEMGFLEMLNASHYCFIEWPDIASPYLRSECFVVTIEILSEEERYYSVVRNKEAQ
jgi:tRNA threonylcarbamoyladenosine biosynthesis protein TsaE